MIIFDIETNGLAKETSRVTCISYQDRWGSVKTIMNEDEKIMIEEFFKVIHEDKGELYSFNGDKFDIPFIIYRAFVTNAKGPVDFKFPKHIDLRKVAGCFFFTYNEYTKGTLNDWALLIGEEVKETNGLEVVAAWNNKDFALIKKHCEQDVKITYKLFNRCREVGLL